MAAYDAFSDEEKQYVRDNAQTMSVAAIAEALGRSKGPIYKLIKQEGISREAPKVQAVSITVQDQPAQQPTHRERLERLRDVLEALLLQAEDRNVAALSKEYRAVLDELERMDAGDASPDPFELLAASIASNL